MGEQLCLMTSDDAPILPAARGSDHAALALMPFTVATQMEPPVTFGYQMMVDEKIRRVNVTLDTVRSARLPMPSDQTVFLGLLQLALREGEPREELRFSRRELFELLRWNERNDGYARLKEALHRLTALLLTIEHEMVARNGQPYDQRQRGAHLIDDYEVGKGRDASVRVVWGHLVREAFRLGDFKRLDWDLLLALDNPITMRLYRLLDRVTLSGHNEWELGWQPLAASLGMDASGYARPARFRQTLEPHIASLVTHGVIEGCDYLRGGRFRFHIRNYLRSALRRVLVERFQVFEEAARQLVAGHDEVTIMAQCDCLQHGTRPKPQTLGGYLVQAVRGSYELRYADDEPEMFCALWGTLFEAEREAYHRAGLKVLGVGEDLFEASVDPTAWSQPMRAVVRFMICHSIEPDEVAGAFAAAGRPVLAPAAESGQAA